MSGKIKSVRSPGLMNLLLLEFVFLLLVVYIGLCLWAGMSVAVTAGIVNFAAGLLFLLMWSQQRGG